MSDEISGVGAFEAPITPESYKRAIYRPPPRRFSIEMLTPIKQGGAMSYGMRISPIFRGDRSSISSDSSSSSSSSSEFSTSARTDSMFSSTSTTFSNATDVTDMSTSSSAPASLPYEIWRRWEDFLYFQDMLELEYTRMARQKKSRLRAGKGVKKHGMYTHDRASSFESLPPGPSPESVKGSIHDREVGIPKLTKKGVMFRITDRIVQQRQEEIKNMVMGLFSGDAPSLVKELRDDRKVVDFFGYWRRDFDLMKAKKKAAEGLTKNGRWRDSTVSFGSVKPKPRAFGMRDRGSVTPSVFSSYFSPSVTESVYEDARQEQTIPEDDAISYASTSSPTASPSPRRNGHRHMSIIGPSRNSEVEVRTPTTIRPNVRESWQTTASAATYLEHLNFRLADGDNANPRYSTASFMTECSADAVMGPFSAPVSDEYDAAEDDEEDYGRSTRAELRRTLSAGSRRRVSIVSTTSSEGWSEAGEDDRRFTAIYDQFPVPNFHLPSTFHRTQSSSSRSETPTPGSSDGSEEEPRTPHALPTVLPYLAEEKDMEELDLDSLPASPTTERFGVSAFSPARAPGAAVTVKVIHTTASGPSIILLRVPTSMPLSDLRDRITSKFYSLSQDDSEGTAEQLGDGFFLGVLVSPPAPTPGEALKANLHATAPTNDGKRRLLGRKRSSSLSSASTLTPPPPPPKPAPAVIRMVTCDTDWQRAIQLLGSGKMTMHVLDCVSAA